MSNNGKEIPETPSASMYELAREVFGLCIDSALENRIPLKELGRTMLAQALTWETAAEVAEFISDIAEAHVEYTRQVETAFIMFTKQKGDGSNA